MQLLGELTPQQFLDEYWQKKPLLIRQAIPGFVSPISPDELAGLACEENVESRLIIEKAGPTPWFLEHGPFAEIRFNQLPDSHFTLLLQQANQHFPELAEFLQQFQFIPNWRVDDVMISYAPTHGSVGPHVDQYDVFLLQGLGRREWKIDTRDTRDVPRVQDTELDILAEFEAEQQWTLEPGDMLYLPPNVAHHGVALEDCMTYSIGFRAPSQRELLTAWVDDVAAHLPDALRYGDAQLKVQAHPGEIDASTITMVRQLLQQALMLDDSIKHWFGRFITEPPAHRADMSPTTFITAKELLQQLESNGTLYRSETSRLAFMRDENKVQIFADGIEISVPASLTTFVAQICDNRTVTIDQLYPWLADQKAQELLARLYNLGVLWIEGDEEDDDAF